MGPMNLAKDRSDTAPGFVTSHLRDLSQIYTAKTCGNSQT